MNYVSIFLSQENLKKIGSAYPPSGFEWVLPSGKITPVVGQPIYISAIGEKFSRQDYINRYRIDPEIAYEYMRGRMRKSASTDTLQGLKHLGFCC